MINPCLYIQKAPGKGRAMFTNKKLAANIIIEESPVLVMHKGDREHLDKTLLYNYIFEWGANKNACCMALGYLPLYNHSYTSNCEYFMNFAEDTIQIKTVRVIEKGEELTINYNGDWNNHKKIWFHVRE